MGEYLVTGGAGFIGSHIVEELLRRGGRVRVLDDFSSGKKENLSALSGRIDLIEGDVRDLSTCKRAVKGVDVIFHLLAAYEQSGEAKYLDRADHFARLGVRTFLGDGSPLPRASSRHDHYEAITRGDTLMMALLRLWQVQHRPKLKLRLVYSDR